MSVLIDWGTDQLNLSVLGIFLKYLIKKILFSDFLFTYFLPSRVGQLQVIPFRGMLCPRVVERVEWV